MAKQSIKAGSRVVGRLKAKERNGIAGMEVRVCNLRFSGFVG